MRRSLIEQKTSFGKSLKDFFTELVKIVIISLAIVLPIRYLLIQPFYVKGASMEPTIYDHEYLIIDEISYRFKEPLRGEIVVFKYPQDKKQYFIKRIIALPGEKIVIREGKVIIFNQSSPEGFILDENDYLLPGTKTPGQEDRVLEEDEYYVLGDNRSSSLDSRRFGPLGREYIIGRTWLRGWPAERMGILSRPKYNL